MLKGELKNDSIISYMVCGHVFNLSRNNIMKSTSLLFRLGADMLAYDKFLKNFSRKALDKLP